MGGVINKLQGLSVPVFFVISSFLFFKKVFSSSNSRNQLLIKFVKRLGIVYLFYFILLSPVIIPNRGWLNLDLITGIKTFLIDILFRYTFPGSWFLSALIVSTTIIFFLCKKINIWILLGIFFILHFYIYNVELLPSSYGSLYTWYEMNIRGITLSFPVALFWTTMGACFAKLNINNNIKKIDCYNHTLSILFLFIFIISFIPTKINGLENVFMVPLLIIIFHNLRLKPSEIYFKFREYSILFFFWHFIVLQVIKVITSNQQFDILGIWLYPITLIPVIVVSSLILYLENIKCFKWLKYSH